MYNISITVNTIIIEKQQISDSVEYFDDIFAIDAPKLLKTQKKRRPKDRLFTTLSRDKLSQSHPIPVPENPVFEEYTLPPGRARGIRDRRLFGQFHLP